MDITSLSPSSVKIKGKLASFIVEPSLSKASLTADAVINFAVSENVPVEGVRLIMQGPGEYEVGGVKITGLTSADTTLYYLSLDGMVLMVGKASALKNKELARDTDIVILSADSVVDASLLATLNPRVALFYGPEAEANIKSLGKEATGTTKYSITREKLPAELEAVLIS